MNCGGSRATGNGNRNRGNRWAQPPPKALWIGTCRPDDSRIDRAFQVRNQSATGLYPGQRISDHQIEEAVRRLRCKLQALSYGCRSRAAYLQEHFVIADKDHDGTLSLPEFVRGMRRICPLRYSEAEAVFHMMDIDADGRIEIEELFSFLHMGSPLLGNPRFKRAHLSTARTATVGQVPLPVERPRLPAPQHREHQSSRTVSATSNPQTVRGSPRANHVRGDDRAHSERWKHEAVSVAGREIITTHSSRQESNGPAAGMHATSTSIHTGQVRQSPSGDTYVDCEYEI